jgi:hypothetical protein
MWMLVLLMVTGNGPAFNAHPKPMSESECQQALVSATQQLEQLQEKAKTDMKFTMRCVQWPGEETAPPVKAE